MFRLIGIIGALVRAAVKGRVALVLENVALRQQVTVLKRGRPRPEVALGDRIFWVVLRRLWSDWAEWLHVVRPETVVRWHRAGFRLFWTW